MKGTGKIIFGIACMSALLLVHVHEQILIFKISYRLTEKSDLLAQRSEEYRRLKFAVDRLKAPRLLEEKIKERSMDLSLPKEVRVVKMPINSSGSRVSDEKQVTHEASMKPTVTGKFMNLLGKWVEVAQAKTEN